MVYYTAGILYGHQNKAYIIQSIRRLVYYTDWRSGVYYTETAGKGDWYIIQDRTEPREIFYL
jgi:hypothetical protein